MTMRTITLEDENEDACINVQGDEIWFSHEEIRYLARLLWNEYGCIDWT